LVSRLVRLLFKNSYVRQHGHSAGSGKYFDHRSAYPAALGPAPRVIGMPLNTSSIAGFGTV